MEVIGKDGRGRGSHGSIHSVVGSGCKYFLTRTTLNGFKVSEDEENGLQVSLKYEQNLKKQYIKNNKNTFH